MGLGDLRHRSTMILKLKVYINGHESGGKPRRGTQQLVNEFHQLAAKNLNVNAVQRSIASVIWYSIQGKKKILYSLFDRPKSGFVRPKNYLAGHHDRRPTVRYFEPWIRTRKRRSRLTVLSLFWLLWDVKEPTLLFEKSRRRGPGGPGWVGYL